MSYGSDSVSFSLSSQDPRTPPDSLCVGGRQQQSCRASGTWAPCRGQGSMEERSKLKLSVVVLSLRRELRRTCNVGGTECVPKHPFC